MIKAPWKADSAILQDLLRYGDGGSLRAFVKHYALTPGFKFTVWLRVTKVLKGAGVLLQPLYYFSRFLLHRCAVRYGIGIPYNTCIGPGLYIGHFGGIVVHSQTIIGRDCNINQDVTIGARYGGKEPGVPVIGDRVYLAPGCKVIGGIQIGNDVAVGANAVVTKSIPERGVVVGIPGKIISFKGSADYVVNTARDRYHDGT